MVCAAGFAVIEELESRSLIDEAQRKGKLFQDVCLLLKSIPKRVSWILGKGMIYSILFKDPSTGKPDAAFTSNVAELCMQGVLVVIPVESIKLGPPLRLQMMPCWKAICS